jgi:arabinogalactan oligomer/maltooligosaccharide transport system substrate-binding protein
MWKPPLRRLSMGLGLLAVAALQGCAPLSLIKGETLDVMVVTQPRLEWLRRSAERDGIWRPLLGEFQRLHPNVPVRLLSIREEDVEQELRLRSSRGLGPDLILARAPMANTLLKKGLIAPVPTTPAMESSIAQVDPRFLVRVRYGARLSGLPVLEEVTLSCYNRREIPTPPRTTDQLTALAASGRTIGLSIDPYGLWWTAATRQADLPLVAILLGEATDLPAATQERRIADWLAWLRGLAIQSNVDIASGPEELSNGLIQGRLDWIPCYSLTLAFLRARMNHRLGVAPLPSGPGGAPSPFSTLRVWAFGLDSSPRQRQNAVALAQLSVDPLMQRRYVLETQEVLPVNRFVQTPVASSGVLAALAIAQEQFDARSSLNTHPFTVEHLTTVAKELETVAQQVMLGIDTPMDGARRLMGQRRPAR